MVTDINLTPTSSQFEIPRQSGSPIPARSWGSPSDCKAVALLVHGLGAHSGWFEAFARQLKIRGIYAVSFDLVGFGRQRDAVFGGYTRWMDDLVSVFDYLKEMNPGKPVFIMGNSMGGLLSLVALEYIQPAGLVLFSPGFDGAPETFTWSYRILTVIKALLRPEMEVALPYDSHLVTRDQSARDFVDRDPEGRFRLPGKYLLELLKISNAVKNKGHQVPVPVLMLTAGKDRIVNNQINMAFFNNLIAPDKQQKHFADAWHDLMFDPLVDEVADEVASFTAKHAAERLTSGS